MEGGRGRGRGLESEREQVLTVAKAAGLGTPEWGKVKVGGRGRRRRKQCSWDPGRTPSRGEGGAGQGGKRRGAAWPASSALGSRRRWPRWAPSLAGALFLCRETRKLPFDCGSPRPGRGARQSGSEWQRGKGGALPAPAASRVRSPPGAAATEAAAAAAAAPARRPPRGKRPAPARRPERAQQVAPSAAVGAPGTAAARRRQGGRPRPRGAMLSRGAGLALCTALSLLQVSGAIRAAGPRSRALHLLVSSLLFGEGGG